MINNRREFIKRGLLGIPAAALVPGALYGKSSNPLSGPPELPSRTLGRTGIKAPVLSFGTSGALDRGFIKAAYEGGIKMFFSATYYGEGRNEKLVGDGLKGYPRNSFIVGTAGAPDELNTNTGSLRKTINTDNYLRKTEESLKHFGLDYIDFFLLPYAGKKETVMNKDLLKTMEKLKKEGITRFTGIASHSDTVEALKAAADSGAYDIAMIAYNFKVKDIELLNDTIDYAVRRGMGIVAMKSASGAVSKKAGSPLNSDAILKWVLKNENITSIVSGMTSLEQLQKNLVMLKNLKLSDQEIKYLNTARSEAGLYCQQCKKCLPQCLNNIDVPALMRSYMYAYGYKNLSHARYILDFTETSGSPCENCRSCSVKCVSGFDVKNKILDISRLKEIPKDLIHA